MTHQILENPRSQGTLPAQPGSEERPLDYHLTLPNYEATPLLSLPEVAERLGVAKVYLKDESWRLGLPSFKMLGASWATAFAIREAWVEQGVSVQSLDDLRRAVENPSAKRLVAATDGNHGRGVARMAKYLGMQCLIFVPRGLARSRIRGIQSEGAKVKIVNGSYDDAIARSAEEANDNTLVVSDTSWEGYQDIPRQVTVGYSTLFAEIDDSLRAEGLPDADVVVLQAGVGSFAAAGMIHYRSGGRGHPPRTIVAEPLSANCLYRSCEAGKLTEAPPPHPSTMAGLNCGLPSQLTWPVLDQSVDVFCGITDDHTYDAMRLLADNGVVAGESGAAGLGALLAVVAGGNQAEREALGLGPDATVLLVNTEGATDPLNYKRVVGVKPEVVAGSRKRRRDKNSVVELGTLEPQSAATTDQSKSTGLREWNKEMTSQSSTIEVQHVNAIPTNERHGKARDLFPVWFSANLNVGNAFFGALAVILGNNLFWAVVAVVLGNLAGAIFMSLHSIQGAKLGVPQLIQSRGQFGFFGALLPIFLAACLYLGFFATTAVIAGQNLSAAIPAMSLPVSIVLVSILSLVLALVGYKAIHVAAKWAMWPLAVAVVVVTAASLTYGGLDFDPAGFQTGPFLSALGIIATFLLTYAPYVSDYSRYLPVETEAKDAFNWTFWGAFLGTTWTMLLGVFLAVQFSSEDMAAATSELFGGGWIVAVILVITAIAVAGNNSLNLYGGMLNLITAGTSFVEVKASKAVRFTMLLPTFIAGTLIALFASAEFSGNVAIFLSFLLLGFVPWGAINLIDYYWVRKGAYDVEAFFKPRGIYFSDKKTWTAGGINWQAFIAYFVGIAVALPFMNNGLVVGFATSYFGDADLSWIPGLIVTGLLYLALTSRNSRAVESSKGA
jgi:diaminopropionate ammonia-lyase family/NCS1 nucleoside transporter family